MQQESHLCAAADVCPRPFVRPCQERRRLSESCVLLHRLAPMRPTTAVHLRHVTTAHRRLGTGLDAEGHLAAGHIVCWRGRHVWAARRGVDRRMGALAGRHHVTGQTDTTSGKATMGKMQLGVLAVVQFAVMLAEGFLDHALVLRLIAVFVVTSLTAMTAVLPAFFMLHSAALGAVAPPCPAAVSVAFALHHLAFMRLAAFLMPLMQHGATVATMLPMDQVLVFRPVHVFGFSVVFEAAVRRVDRRTVMVVMAHHAVWVVNGMTTMGMVLDDPAIRLVLGVHDMMSVRMVLAVDFSTMGVMVHDLVFIRRMIGKMTVVPDRPRWRGAVEPELAMLGTEFVVEEIAFDVLDCHDWGSYRLPMSGYLR